MRNAKTFDGTPCKIGHTTRYESSRGCVVCSSERQKVYYRARKKYINDRNNTYRRAKYAADPEAACRRVANYRATNKEKVRAAGRAKYYANHEARLTQQRAYKKK